MSKHTPGPWEFAHEWVQTVDKKTPIANFNFYAATEANARLIAAAPTMYEYIASSASNGCAEAAKILEAIHAGS